MTLQLLIKTIALAVFFWIPTGFWLGLRSHKDGYGFSTGFIAAAAVIAAGWFMGVLLALIISL